MAFRCGAILLLVYPRAAQSHPIRPAWRNQAELFCTERSAMSRPMCRHFMRNGAKIAALAFRNGHDREARICVEDNKRQNGGYLDLASAGVCMIRAGVF